MGRPSCVGADATTNTQGTCQAAIEASGATCDPSETTGPSCDRNAGLVCNGMSKTCQAIVLAAAGQPCGDVGNQTATCSTEGFCTGSSGSTPGTCTAAGADGAACNTGSGTNCIEPGRCVGSTGDGGITGTCQYAGTQTCGG